MADMGEGLQAAVEEALEALDTPESHSWKIPISAQLLSMRLAVARAGPLLEPGTKRGACRELENLHRALLNLDDALSSLSMTATNQLETARDELGLQWIVSIPQPIRPWLADNYPGLADATRQAAAALEGAPAKRGRAADVELQALCRDLADHYFGLTGRKPSRGDDTYERPSSFFRLVQRIFDAAELPQNAEHYTRWAAEDLELRSTKPAELIHQEN